MRAYYNEIDTFAAAWLRKLIAEGLIAPGDVDVRDIRDVTPGDLVGYAQCHFFAGIGVWSLALRTAGWPDNKPVWTGSCPCQPFSAAGKRDGFADERHLWPAFFHLIRECRPPIVLGEQVASKDGLAWLDLVQADMEGEDHAFGAVDTCAAGFGAPHIRQRLYFAAKRLDHATSARHEREIAAPEGEARNDARLCLPDTGRRDVGMADACGEGEGGRGIFRPGEGRSAGAGATCERPARLRATGGVADTDPTRQQGRGERWVGAGKRIARSCGLECEEPGMPGPVNGLWEAADWLFCRDGKWRPIEPETFPLADAGAYRNRVAELRGSGNAINLAQAAEFARAYLECRE